MLRQRRWPFKPNEPPNDTWTHISNAFGESPGIYILRVGAGAGSVASFQSPRRLFDVDETGRLYVGSGIPVINRFGGLRTGVYAAYGFLRSSGKPYGNVSAHGAARKMSASFMKAYLLEDLVIDVVSWDAGDEVPPDYNCRHHEAQVLAAYMERFGEAPPLNSARPAVKPGRVWIPEEMEL